MAQVVSNLEFGAQIEKWVLKTEKRMNAVLRESTKRLISEAQSRIPVDTGFARASIQVSLDAMPQAQPESRGQKGQTYTVDLSTVTAVITSAKFGDHIYIGWTANYAIYLEYGHSKQAPSGFVRVSAAMWPEIVSQVTAEVRNRIESSGGSI